MYAKFYQLRNLPTYTRSKLNMDQATLARVEEQRQQLEANIATLRKSLRHWQTLEIDYEGLKEEFLGLPDSASSDQCFQAAKEFKPELVDEKELRTLIIDQGDGHKKPSQLVDLFAKRSEYVLRNIDTIRKQLSNAEKKRNALLLAEIPDYQDEAGLPLREITEELDDEGEVISSQVQAPGGNPSQLVDVLRKAGVTDLPISEKDVKKVEDPETKDSIVSNTTKDETSPQIVEMTSNGAQTPPSEDETEDSSVGENGGQDNEVLGPTNPEDTEEDAALRQEMLQYGLGEVGAIVAELDLQEDASDVPYDEYDEDEEMSDYDDDEELDSEQSEDERGASKSTIMSDKYLRKMEFLQKKFAAEGLQNLGPGETLPENIKENLDRPSAAEAARRAALARANSSSNTEETKSSLKQSTSDENKPAKKQVAFAQELDISSPETINSTRTIESNRDRTPIIESIIERSPSTSTNTLESNTTSNKAPAPPSQPKKLSKFKASRLSHPPTPMYPPPDLDFPSPSTSQSQSQSGLPNPPTKSIISPSLIERPPKSTLSPSNTKDSPPLPPDPLDFDESLHRREVALEYQRARNRHIHLHQGGYVRGGEEDNYGDEVSKLPVVEDETTGKVRKVSRFKAARSGGLGGA